MRRSYSAAAGDYCGRKVRYMRVPGFPGCRCWKFGFHARRFQFMRDFHAGVELIFRRDRSAYFTTDICDFLCIDVSSHQLCDIIFSINTE